MTNLWWMVLLGLGLAMAGSATTVVADTVASEDLRVAHVPSASFKHHCIGEPPIGWLICMIL